jgi:hypothetical protein
MYRRGKRKLREVWIDRLKCMEKKLQMKKKEEQEENLDLAIRTKEREHEGSSRKI